MTELRSLNDPTKTEYRPGDGGSYCSDCGLVWYDWRKECNHHIQPDERYLVKEPD